MPLKELDNGLNALPLGIKAIALVGFPVALCLILIGRDIAIEFGWVESQIERRYAELINSHHQLYAQTMVNNSFLVQNQGYLKKNDKFNLAICLNTAKNEKDTDRCLQAANDYK